MPGRLTAPFNYDVPVSPDTVDRHTGQKARSPFFSQEHVDWFLEQQTRTEDTPEQLGRVSLTAQGATIAATPVPLPTITAGRYRVSYFTRVTRAATTSSELIITIGWTTGVTAITRAGATLTGNTLATFDQSTLFLKVAANAALTYAAAYTSVGGTSMQFELEVIVEKLPD